MHCLNLACDLRSRSRRRRGAGREEPGAAEIEIEREARAEHVDVLTVEEQRTLATCELNASSDREKQLMHGERLMALVAMGTGIRQGEQWNLELRDVHVDEAEPWLFVRWGSPGKAPKNGKVRRVPLFGLALAAMNERWLAMLPSWAEHYPARAGLPYPARQAPQPQGSVSSHGPQRQEAADADRRVALVAASSRSRAIHPLVRPATHLRVVARLRRCGVVAWSLEAGAGGTRTHRHRDHRGVRAPRRRGPSLGSGERPDLWARDDRRHGPSCGPSPLAG